MNKPFIALVLCLAVGLALPNARAQLVPQPKNPQNPFAPQGAELADVPLSAASIQNLISSFGALRAEFKDYRPSGDAQGMQNYMQGNEAAFRKAESIVRAAGFKDFADWSAHFSKTMQTYMAYKMQQSSKVNQAQLDRQIEAVRNDKSLTEEQKQMALNMMGMANMYTQMAEGVPEADLKTIKPFVGQLEQVMQSGK